MPHPPPPWRPAASEGRAPALRTGAVAAALALAALLRRRRVPVVAPRLLLHVVRQRRPAPGRTLQPVALHLHLAAILRRAALPPFSPGRDDAALPGASPLVLLPSRAPVRPSAARRPSRATPMAPPVAITRVVRAPAPGRPSLPGPVDRPVSGPPAARLVAPGFARPPAMIVMPRPPVPQPVAAGETPAAFRATAEASFPLLARPATASPAGEAAVLAPAQIERLTEAVMRGLDRRFVAARERLGRG